MSAGLIVQDAATLHKLMPYISKAGSASAGSAPSNGSNGSSAAAHSSNGSNGNGAQSSSQQASVWLAGHTSEALLIADVIDV